MAENERDLQNALNSLNVATGRMDLHINVSKTKLRYPNSSSSDCTMNYIKRDTDGGYN
ncbi:unnamed protein product, partial [Timema podura]|nr:unnamed protein product [Timema podura]